MIVKNYKKFFVYSMFLTRTGYSFLTKTKVSSNIKSFSFTSRQGGHRNFTSSLNYNDNGDIDKINRIYHRTHNHLPGFALDVGCGYGETTRELQMQYPELKWYGIDKNERNIKIARKKYTTCDYLNINIEDYNDIKKDIFNIVNINDYSDLMSCFIKSLSVLSQGGLLIYNCKSLEDTYRIRNFILKNNIVNSKETFFTNTSYYIYEKKIFVFK